MKLRSFFKPPSPEQRTYWQQVRARGKKRFVLRTGFIGWGGTMFFVMTAMELLSKPRFPRGLVDYIGDITINLLICPLGGFVWGIWAWHSYEKRFGEGDGQQVTTHR